MDQLILIGSLLFTLFLQSRDDPAAKAIVLQLVDTEDTEIRSKDFEIGRDELSLIRIW
jgi:hypothetical protein